VRGHAHACNFIYLRNEAFENTHENFEFENTLCTLYFRARGEADEEAAVELLRHAQDAKGVSASARLQRRRLLSSLGRHWLFLGAAHHCSRLVPEGRWSGHADLRKQTIDHTSGRLQSTVDGKNH
jgi:hypothetical protein